MIRRARLGDTLVVGESRVTIQADGNRLRLEIEAPKDVPVYLAHQYPEGKPAPNDYHRTSRPGQRTSPATRPEAGPNVPDVG